MGVFVLTFYDKFIRLCNQASTTPSKVAEEIGLNRSSATGWKKGFKPTDVTMAKIADYFCVEVEDLEDDPIDTLQSIKDEERALLHSYRTMTEEQKKMMQTFIRGIKNAD